MLLYPALGSRSRCSRSGCSSSSGVRRRRQGHRSATRSHVATPTSGWDCHAVSVRNVWACHPWRAAADGDGRSRCARRAARAALRYTDRWDAGRRVGLLASHARAATSGLPRGRSRCDRHLQLSVARQGRAGSARLAGERRAFTCTRLLAESPFDRRGDESSGTPASGLARGCTARARAFIAVMPAPSPRRLSRRPSGGRTTGGRPLDAPAPQTWWNAHSIGALASILVERSH